MNRAREAEDSLPWCSSLAPSASTIPARRRPPRVCRACASIWPRATKRWARSRRRHRRGSIGRGAASPNAWLSCFPKARQHWWVSITAFRLLYFERFGLKRDWHTFLDDFHNHWPTDGNTVWVRNVLRGEVGSADRRMGDMTCLGVSTGLRRCARFGMGEIVQRPLSS